MQQWNIYRPNKTHGPFSPGQLKQFADTGKLRPSDIVGLVGSEERFQALKVVGLFTNRGLSSGATSQGQETNAEETLWIRINGRKLGPFTRGQLHKMASAGEINDSVELSENGLSWATATHFAFSAKPHTTSHTSQYSSNSSSPSQACPVTQDQPGATETEHVPKMWYVHIAGRNYGPMSQQKLIALRIEGQISDAALLWRESLESWIPIDSVLEIKGEKPTASTSQRWFVLKNGMPAGPFTEQAIRSQVSDRQITPDDLICPAGGTIWNSVDAVFGFGLDNNLNNVRQSQQVAFSESPSLHSGIYRKSEEIRRFSRSAKGKAIPPPHPSSTRRTPTVPTARKMPIEDYDPIGNALQKTATAGAAVQTQAVNWLYRTMDSVGSLSFTKRFMQNRRNSAIASFSAIGMFIVVISIIKDFDKHLGEDSPVTALIALIGFSFLFIAPLLAAGAWVGCPNCHRTWARLYQTRRHLESTSGAALVDRTDVHKNAKNETIGTSDRTEQVAVVRSTYRYFWKCRFCAHQWATLRNFVSQEW